MSSIAVFDDGLVPGSEYESLCARGCYQEPIRRVPVRLSGEEGTLHSRICIEWQKANAGWSQRTSDPIAKRGGKLDPSFCMLDANLPDRNRGYPEPVFPPGLFQFLHAGRG